MATPNEPSRTNRSPEFARLQLPRRTFAFVLAGCNTVRGIGQDIEKGGEAIQKATK